LLIIAQAALLINSIMPLREIKGNSLIKKERRVLCLINVNHAMFLIIKRSVISS